MKKPGFLVKNWQQLLSLACGLVLVGLMLAFAVAIPTPTATQWFVFRVVLSLAAAGIGAVIPGLIVVNVSTVVRAGGAIALFVLVYWINPPSLLPVGTEVTIQQNTSGTNSPAVVSGGDVTIEGKK